MRRRWFGGGWQAFGAATRCNSNFKLLAAIWILAVAARLILINQPYIDHWSWRQSDVAAIARNFLENGFRFAYPQIDWAGDATGYVGTEFPILPFLAALCYKFAGIHEWIGRSQAVIFFAVSLPFFFLLVREIFGNTAAIWAAFFFSFAPANVFAGRSFMPDVPSLSLSIMGLYFFLRWTQDREWVPFWLAAIAISLSLLIKITSIVIAAPLAYLAVTQTILSAPKRSQTRLSAPLDYGAHRAPLQMLALFLAIAILPSLAWYWHAHQIAERFYPHHFFGAGGVRIENLSWYWGVAQQTATSSLTPILSVMAMIGLFVAESRHRGFSRLFHWWLAAMIFFVIIVGYGNRHRWYQLPLVPIAAAFAGAACAFIGSKISAISVKQTILPAFGVPPFRRRNTGLRPERRVNAELQNSQAGLPASRALSMLLGCSFALLSYLYVRPFYQPSAAQLRDAGLELNKITARDALIVAADMGDPTIFYYAHRKGWHFPEEDAIYAGTPGDSREVILYLEQLRRGGATHFVFTSNTLWWLGYYPEFAQHLAQTATLTTATPEFRIYRLSASR